MKVIIEYDPTSGQLIDAGGTVVASFYGLKYFDVEETKNNIQALVELKEAGYTAQEVMQMKREGLI